MMVYVEGVVRPTSCRTFGDNWFADAPAPSASANCRTPPSQRWPHTFNPNAQNTFSFLTQGRASDTTLHRHFNWNTGPGCDFAVGHRSIPTTGTDFQVAAKHWPV